MPVYKVIYHQNDYFLNQTGIRKYQDYDAIESVINYCLNPEKTPSSYIGAFGVSIHQAAMEMKLLAQSCGNDRGLHLRHRILSFSEEEVRQLGSCAYARIFNMARAMAEYYRYSYQIIFALHEDHPLQPHVHFVMNTVNFVTGKKYDGKIGDYKRFQQHMINVLAPYHMMLLTVKDN